MNYNKVLAILIFLLGICLVLELTYVSALSWDNYAYYNCEEGSGAIIIDRVLGNFNATGNYGYSTSKKLGTYSCYFNSQYADTTINLGTDNFTLNAWVNWTVLNALAPNPIFGRGINYRWGLGSSYDVGGKLAFWAGDGVTWNEHSDTKAGDILIDEYYMVTLVRNGINIKIYLNGTETLNTSISAGYSFVGPIKIGMGADGTSVAQSRIDEVSIFNRSLSATDVIELYNNHSGLNYQKGNLTINITSPASSVSNESITINITTNSTFNLSYCYYNITRGASTEKANTSLNISGIYAYENYTLSGEATYVVNVWCNDTFNSINTSSKTFVYAANGSTPVTPVSPGGGGGGAIVNIITQLTNKTTTNICEKNKAPLDAAWLEIKKETNWNKFVVLWRSYWDYSLCKSAATIIPIDS